MTRLGLSWPRWPVSHGDADDHHARWRPVWSIKALALAAAAVFVLSAWLTVTSISFLATDNLWGTVLGDIKQLEKSYATLLSETQSSTSTFVDQISDLKAASDYQQDAIQQLNGVRSTLTHQVERSVSELKTMTTQRDRARSLVQEFEQAMSGAEDLLQSVVAEKTFLKQRLASTQTQLGQISHQREAGRRVEMGLRWQLATAENKLKSMQAHREIAQVWLKEWVMGSSVALEQLFTATGVDVEQLVARAAVTEIGQGGPFQRWEGATTNIGGGDPSGDPISGNILRLAALQKLARLLPLSSPLDHFSVTSSFGKRRDPITNNWAFHGGLDFGAAPGSRIRTTAPGKVVHAGSSGPYGNMVEIDHGMGVRTRYGHLKSIKVELGQEVLFRQSIGIIGNTGRSTARHLHYEVWVDEKVYDPAKFLDAGRYLVGIFDVTEAALGIDGGKS